ncbi:LytTR family transcriptional regulator [Marinilongibacter aquaticus]|uniref:LytTR family DNA-binding domain-containing protein n=1 Tax=Marinilongibacter aquaticus TaxID=2975157 RepID=UPI0021BD05D6|nr:LytTR family DNA-binding domain-containing protein [Marinilongibacter aquaticus]UBM60909.1 LytTR family transcriptional regulator [Marinilongibacter aquaticus]
MKPTKQPVYLGPRTSLTPSEVTHLEAEINYTRVYSQEGKTQLLSYTMKNVHALLNKHGNFIRISHKHVVNMDFVKETSKEQLLLKNGLRLCPSRRKRKQLEYLFS